MNRKKDGFTLIELMIVVAVIGILAAIAIPKFADLVRKANEGQEKGNLGAIRSAISLYCGENEGWFPVPTASGDETVAGSLGEILVMQNGKYLKEMPPSYCPPYHMIKDSSVSVWSTASDETNLPGRWGYKNVENAVGKRWGDIWVNCTHTDTKSVVWTTY